MLPIPPSGLTHSSPQIAQTFIKVLLGESNRTPADTPITYHKARLAAERNSVLSQFWEMLGLPFILHLISGTSKIGTTQRLEKVIIIIINAF